MTARAAAAVPFTSGAGLVGELAGITLTGKRLGRHAEADGRAAAAVIKAEAAAIAARTLVPLPPPAPVPDKLYVAIDGTGVPMMTAETDGRPGKGEDGKARTREVKLACAFTQTRVDDDGYPVRDPRLLQLPGHLRARRRVRDADGRRGPPPRRRARPPADHPRRRRALDLEPGQPSISPKPPRSWTSTTPASTCTTSPGCSPSCSAITTTAGSPHAWTNSTTVTSRRCCPPPAHFPLTGIKAGELDTALGYFETNAPRMRYKHFRSCGLFVGSGAVEAGCKAVIGQRLKLSGMHWSMAGATGILTLRCQQASGRWEQIWQHPHNQAGAA